MTIYLQIADKDLRAYLAYLFGQPISTDPVPTYSVSTKVEFGSMLVDQICTRQSAYNPDLSEEWVCFELPLVLRNKSSLTHHMYYSKEATARLVSGLRSYFNIDFDRHFLAGRKIGEQQRHIIQSFIVTRKLLGELDAETLKKRAYREELSLLKQKTKTLINRAIKRNDQISYNDAAVKVNLTSVTRQIYRPSRA